MTRFINANQAVFLLCDVQQVFEPLIYKMGALKNSISLLLKSMNTFQVPIIVTEHYSKAFGKTLPELDQILSQINHKRYEKRVYSMMNQELEQLQKKTIILTGIETHVCVLQTALDFLDKGYKVCVIEDAVSSQRQLDRQIALNRMRQEGVIISINEDFTSQRCKKIFCRYQNSQSRRIF